MVAQEKVPELLDIMLKAVPHLALVGPFGNMGALAGWYWTGYWWSIGVK